MIYIVCHSMILSITLHTFTVYHCTKWLPQHSRIGYCILLTPFLILLISVVSFVTDKDKDLSQLFRSTMANDENVSKLFSRRRRLRRRIKEGSLNIHEVSNV